MSDKPTTTTKSASPDAISPERRAALEAHVAGTPAKDHGALLATFTANGAPEAEIALVAQLTRRPLPTKPAAKR